MSGPLISTEALASRLGDPRIVIVDVRHDLAQPDHWGESQYRAGHIPGAVFAHIDRDLSAPKTGRNGRHPLPPVEDTEAVFSRLGIGNESDVVVYDQAGGMFASRLWWMLRWLGHDAVAVLDGGFDKWQREHRPVETEVRTPAPQSFAARSVGTTVQASDVIEQFDRPHYVLVDARMAERFRGEIEPLDPVAGHIPGARNRPYTDNLLPDGTFKRPDALAREFRELLGATPLEEVVHYCGSGVTSCHNVLAMEVAGLPGTRIYPGSWSEWVADPARPVAVGNEGHAR